MPANSATLPNTATAELSRQELEQQLLQAQQSLQQTADTLQQRNEELKQQLEAAATSHSQQEQLFSLINATLQTAKDGIILMDEDDSPILFNQRAAEFLDTSQGFIGCADSSDLLELLQNNSYNAEVFEQQLAAIQIQASASTSGTLELLNGVVLEVYSQARMHDDEVIGRVWNFHDITELRNNEREIRYRAFHDPLTELPNRHLFSDRILTALSRQQRTSAMLALLFIDLDGFKYVNDSLGHEVGDLILQEVAKRLKIVVREQDTVARHGGDEFLVLLENVANRAQLSEVAERILHTLSQPFSSNGQDIFMSASIGVSLAPQDGVEPEFLIRNADMAMYQAKKEGRNNYQFFRPYMMEHSSRQLLLQSQLSQALQNNEFRLYYQPKICLETGIIVGAEALIRWQKDNGDIIAPGEFIETAEQCGLIIPISEWVLQAACTQLQQWSNLVAENFVLSINLSAIHFKQKSIVSDIMSSLEQHNIAPHNFELELTESIVIDNPAKSIATLNELRDSGIKLSIDDFGTGYSSFNYLKELPITAIKIDKSFIENIDVFFRDLALVKSIIDIAHILELEVVAEGIETTKMQNLLKQANCDTAQGYLYSRPVPPEQFSELLSNK